MSKQIIMGLRVQERKLTKALGNKQGIKTILTIKLCFTQLLCLTFLLHHRFISVGAPHFCLIPFWFSSVYNYWNIWVPSCSIFSSEVNICSVFICCIVFIPKERKMKSGGLFIFCFTILKGFFVSLWRLPEYGTMDLC